MKILIAIPAYNEELIIKDTCLSILDYCRQNFINDQFELIIADNNSSDQTGNIAQKLALSNPEIIYLHLDQKGKGLAWLTAWQNYSADVYVFMDADLAVDLSALKPLSQSIAEGSDIALGSRFLKDSKVTRSLKREIISRAYNFLAKLILKTKITDLSCGFKAINQKTKNNILPLVQDREFFADAELVLLAEKQNYKIKEIPVNWSEFRNQKKHSRVPIAQTIKKYLIQIWNIKKRLAD